jgi:hypothetical protein
LFLDDIKEHILLITFKDKKDMIFFFLCHFILPLDSVKSTP